MTAAAEPLAPAMSRGDRPAGDAWRRFRRNRLAMIGLVVVAILVGTATLAPWLAPQDPGKQTLIEKRARPGGKYLLGSDEFGRDILSRVIYGTRVALLVGLVSVGIALGAGLLLGCLAGFVGGVPRKGCWSRLPEQMPGRDAYLDGLLAAPSAHSPCHVPSPSHKARR